MWPFSFEESIIPEDADPNNTPLVRYKFMLTSLVQGWLQGLPNNGIVLLTQDEARSPSRGRRFTSSTFSASNNGPIFTVTYASDTSSSDNIGIENNATYYIKCKGSVTENSTSTVPLYLTAPTTTSGYVKLQALASDEEVRKTQEWQVKSAGNGYYYLYPASNPTYTLYANGDVNYETKVGNLTDAGWDDYKKWKFVRNWDGSYHIESKAGSGTLGLGVIRTGANVLAQHTWLGVDMHHLDDWTLEKVDKTSLDSNVFCFNSSAAGYATLDTEQFVSNYQSYITSMGYSFSKRLNKDASEGISSLSTSDLWVFSGHGNASMLSFADTTYLVAERGQFPTNSSCFPIKEIYSVGDLSNLRLAMLASCVTGDDYEKSGVTYNLVGTLYRKGAHFVQAYLRITTQREDEWLKHFFEACESGETIADAIEYADNIMRPTWGDWNAAMCNRHILGDTAMCLNPQP